MGRYNTVEREVVEEVKERVRKLFIDYKGEEFS
jgi:hypothetical protein